MKCEGVLDDSRFLISALGMLELKVLQGNNRVELLPMMYGFYRSTSSVRWYEVQKA